MSSAPLDGWTSPLAPTASYGTHQASLLTRPAKQSIIELRPYEPNKHALMSSQFKLPRGELVNGTPAAHRHRRQSGEPHREPKRQQQVENRRTPRQCSTSNFGQTLIPSRQVPPRPKDCVRQSEHCSNVRHEQFRRPLGPSKTIPPAPEVVRQRRAPEQTMDRSLLASKSFLNHRAPQNPLNQQLLNNHVAPGHSNTGFGVELSSTRRRELIARVNGSVQDILTSILSDKSTISQWKLKLHKKDIYYYMDEVSVKPGQTRFCYVSHTHATVEDIMKLFVVSDADTMLRNNNLIFENLVESRVLSVLRRPTTDRPYHSMYVQYSSYNGPSLLGHRQTCLAVATNIIRQPDGSIVGYCLWESIKEPEFGKKSSLKTQNMFRSGFFFRRSGRQVSSNQDPHLTKIVYMIGLESSGCARRLMQYFGTNLVRLCTHLRSTKLNSQNFVMKTQWVSKMAVRSCNTCAKAFQVLSSRVNCHACGRVVCRSCTSKEYVEVHPVGLIPMQICFVCLEKAGLPASISFNNTQSVQRRPRVQSDTTSFYRVNAQPQQPQHPQSKSVLECDVIEEEDDDDDGEWVFTTSGQHVRPYRIHSAKEQFAQGLV